MKIDRALAIFFLCMSLAVSAFAIRVDDQKEFKDVQARENRGFSNPFFFEDDQFLISKIPKPDDVLEIEPSLFMGSRHILVSRARDGNMSGPFLQSRFGRRINIQSFQIFREQLVVVFRRHFGFSDSQSEAIANELERQAVVEARIRAVDYDAVVPRAKYTRAEFSHFLKKGMEDLFLTSDILRGCDVPFIGGYHRDNEKEIYIDRAVPETKTFSGVEAPLIKLLNVHERIEKAILVEYQTSYPHAHQIALRVEKLTADALGIPWQKYDANWSKINLVTKKVSRTLDMTPYLTFTDAYNLRLIKKMKLSMVDREKCLTK